MRISIVGCGWLGLPLATHLLGQGHHVLGSTRQKSELNVLSEHGIEAYLLDLRPQLVSDNIKALLNCELLIVNIPPGRKRNSAEFHIQQIQALLSAVLQSETIKVLFISSTSVYGPTQGPVNENSSCQPVAQSGVALKNIEQQLLAESRLKTSVLRFSGLVGGKRKPGRFLSGKTVSGAQSPVNIIHREDCIQLISALIQRDVWGEVFNACSDLHPSKQAFYTLAAEQLGLASPQFSPDNGSNKQVDNAKLKAVLNYSFIYPDPMQWLVDSHHLSSAGTVNHD